MALAVCLLAILPSHAQAERAHALELTGGEFLARCSNPPPAQGAAIVAMCQMYVAGIADALQVDGRMCFGPRMTARNIEHVEYFVDGRDVGSDKNVPDDKLGGDEIQPVEFDPEDPMGSGDKEWIYFRKTKNTKQLQQFADFVDDHLAIEVRYCSVYGRCWDKCSTAGKCKQS